FHPLRAPTIPDIRTFLSPSRTQSPTSAIRASRNFPCGTCTAPRADDLSVSTFPAASSLYARKFEVPQLIAIIYAVLPFLLLVPRPDHHIRCCYDGCENFANLSFKV